MATIKHYKNDALLTGGHELHENIESVAQWILNTFNPGEAFSVYCGEPCAENLIPNTAEDLAAIGDGEYVVIETPAGGAIAYAIIAVVVAVAVIALTPKPNLPKNVNRQQESPNNQLSSRSNQARPLQRIPDIKGEVLSVPDIIMPTYSIYSADTEIEHGFYCIGRKQYDVASVKDGDTPIELITGSGAGIYYPGNNPNNSAPDIQIGDEILRSVCTPYRINQINGVTMPSDYADEKIEQNNFWVYRVTDTTFGIAYTAFGSGSEWSSVYETGTNAILDTVFYDTNDLSGEFEIIGRFYLYQIGTSFRQYFITLDFGAPHGIPSAGLPGWGLPTVTQTQSVASSTQVESTDWAYFTKEKASSVILNVVAPNGMYKDNGGVDLITRTVDYEFELQEVDDTNTAIGVITTIEDFIQGNTQKLRGKTTEHIFSTPRKFRARAIRITPRDTAFSGTVVDDIKWEDCYAIINLDNSHDFGDVTLIQTKTQATPFATAVKDRQLNCIATEMLNVYEGFGTFNSSLTPNNNAIQSFIKDSIDPVIGNRSLSEIDADGLLDIDQEINDYFSAIGQTEFSYTYDSTDVSYQDYAQQALNAINCIGYRDGSIIKAIFEKPVDSPSILFTHRSKIPGTERYSRNFNQSELNDGVEFNWVDPDTNTNETLYIPADKSAVNPKQFNIPGIRNYQQAMIRANREYNKIRLAKVSLSLSVAAEGRYVLPNDVIAVVKGSRVYTEDGEILAQNGLILTLSQDVEFQPLEVHSVTLKADDGTTENIIVTAGAESNQVILSSAPAMTIRTGIDSRRTEFSFGTDSRHESQLWLSQEIDVSNKLEVALKAINYDLGYYAGDSMNFFAFSNGFNEGFG